MLLTQDIPKHKDKEKLKGRVKKIYRGSIKEMKFGVAFRQNRTSIFKNYFIYLFLERGERRKTLISCLSYLPQLGLDLQPGHVT